jgi:hypothetical protein
MRLSSAVAVVGTGRNLGFLLFAWFAFLWWTAWAFPPLDSRLEAGPLTSWAFIIVAIPLALLTTITILAYLYQSWLMLTGAPNKTLHALWLGFVTLLLLGAAVWLDIQAR